MNHLQFARWIHCRIRYERCVACFTRVVDGAITDILQAALGS